MTAWTSSRVAWAAALVSLFGLLRALRRLVPAEERPEALAVAVGVVVLTALLPATSGMVKAGQLLTAGIVTAAATYLGTGVLLAGLVGIGAALLLGLLWPAPRPRDA